MVTSPSSSAPQRSEPAEHRVALLIGINEYQNAVPPLRNAVRDVQAVAQVLRDEHGYHTELILDEEATLANLRTRFSALGQTVSATTRLVLYFAGHGIAEEIDSEASGPQGFLIPQDAHRDNPATFLPMTEVQGLLAGLPCKHLLLLLDCCFAGAFRWSQTRTLRPRATTLYRERFERYQRDSAWQVITSSAHDERAADWLSGRVLGDRGDARNNSPFAAALCRGLRGEADLRVGGHPGDGVILASELHLYLEAAFERMEQQLGRRLQKPMLWSLAGHDKGQFFFLLPGGGPALPVAAELNERNDPYRGLQSYDEAHRSLFFGRSAATEALCTLVQAESLVVVVGASGTGKSSLVRAGLLPRLRAVADPTWEIVPPARPGTTPLAMLQTLAGQLQPGASQLTLAARDFCQRNPGRKALLVIDQVEEVASHAAPELPAFLALIAEARRAGGGQVHIVLTLRADFEPYFGALWGGDADAAGRFLIPPMSRGELREAIEGPASERVLYFDPPTLVDRLLDEVADTPGPLPLLSFVLSEMYRASLRRPRDRTLSEADYQALGGVAGALTQRADAVYASCADAADQRAFRYLLLRMVVPGELARKRVLDSELQFANPDEQARVGGIVKRLLAERLLVSDLDSRGRRFVEPAHDKLVMGWPRLGQFLAEDKGYLLQHSLAEAALQWQQGGRARTDLWDRDPLLPQALATQQQQPGRYNAMEEEFIAHSQKRKRFVQSLAVAAVLLIFVGLSALLWRERRTSQAQRQQLLASYEERGRQFLLGGDPASALLWLNRAYQQGADGTSLRFLLAQATMSEGIALPPLARHRGSVKLAHFSPDGSRLVTVSNVDPVPNVWDTRTGELVYTLAGHSKPVADAVYSSDGRWIATRSEDKTVKLWDAGNGMLLDSLPHETWIGDVAFSPDGTHVLTTSANGALRTWSTANGAVLSARIGSKGLSKVDFSPGGRFLIGRGYEGTIDAWNAGSGDSTSWTVGERLSNNIPDAAFSADGNHIHILSRSGAVSFDLRTQKPGPETRLARDLSTDAWMRVVPGGRHLIVSEPKKKLHIFELPSGKQVGELPDAPADSRHVVLARDGTRFLWLQAAESVRVFDLAGGQLFFQSMPGVESAEFSRDSTQIVTWGDRREVQIWNLQSGTLQVALRLQGPASQLSPAVPPRGGRYTAQSEMLWAGHSGTPLRAFDHRGGVLSLGFGADEQHMLIVSRQPGWGPIADADVHTLAADGTDEERHLGRPAWGDRALLSPDGRTVLAPTWDLRAQIYDTESGVPRLYLRGHEARVLAVAISDDGSRVATGGADKTAKIWDAGSGQLLASLGKLEYEPTFLVFSADGQRLLTANRDHLTPQYWDVQAGKLLTTLPSLSIQLRLASLPRDSHSAIFGTTAATYVIDTASGRTLAEYATAEKGYLLAVSPDGRRLVTDQNSRLLMLDAGSGALLLTLAEQDCAPGTVAFSPDSEHIVSAGQDHQARIFNATSGLLEQTLSGHSGSLHSVQFSADGSRVLTASEDKTARLYDAKSGRQLQVFAGSEQPLARASLSRDGQRMLAVGAYHQVTAWDVASGGRLSVRQGQSFTLQTASYSPDGRQILTDNDDNIVRIWDPQGREIVHLLPKQPEAVFGAQWAPDSRHFFTLAEDKVKLWDGATDEPLLTLATPNNASDRLQLVPQALLSPDGSRIVTLGADQTMRLWDRGGGALLLTLDGRQYAITAAAFSPDSQALLTINASTGVRILDGKTGQLLGELQGHTDTVLSATWSRDSRSVLTASVDRTARIFAMRSRTLQVTMAGHSRRVVSAVFSPGGERVLTTSLDGTAKIWDAQSGAQLASFDGQDSQHPLAAFSPDGLSVLTAYQPQGGTEQGQLPKVRLWRFYLESRSREDINSLCQCRVPLRFDGELLVSSRRDAQACQRLPRMQ